MLIKLFFLVGRIVVVRSGALAVAAPGDQFRAADEADHIAVLLLLRHSLAFVETVSIGGPWRGLRWKAHQYMIQF